MRKSSLMGGGAIALVCAVLFGGMAQADEMKLLVFGGPSRTSAWSGPLSYSLNGGVGLKFSVSKKFEVGPVITVSEIFPQGKSTFVAGQANVWGFYHLTRQVSLFGGPGETAQFLRTGTLYLPTMTGGLSLRFSSHWAAALPLSITKAGSHGGFSIGPRLVYTFGSGKH